MSKNILFISPQTIKDRTGLHENVDEKLVFPVIKTAQDKNLLGLLGTGLFNRLQIAIGNLTAQTAGQPYTTELLPTADELILLNDYLADCLVYLTLAELPLSICWQFYNKGVVRKAGDNTVAPSSLELNQLSELNSNSAEFYKQRLIDYLRADNVQPYKFPTYQQWAGGVGVVPPNGESYEAPMYLGGDYDYRCDTSIPAYLRFP